VVTAYVNGEVRFSFIDTALDATHPNGRLYFFVDDRFKNGPTDASGGTLNYLRVFNGALNSTEVSTLFAAGPPLAIPEEPIAILLSIGLIVSLVCSARKKVWL
jgi:hypothetical protein